MLFRTPSNVHYSMAMIFVMSTIDAGLRVDVLHPQKRGTLPLYILRSKSYIDCSSRPGTHAYYLLSAAGDLLDRFEQETCTISRRQGTLNSYPSARSSTFSGDLWSDDQSGS